MFKLKLGLKSKCLSKVFMKPGEFQSLFKLYLNSKSSNKMIQKIAFFILFVIPVLSYASTQSGFPAREIFFQIFNFFLFFVILIYFIRTPMKTFFHKRQEEFFSFEKLARELEEKNQKEYQTWLEKLENLKTKEENINSRAKEEGENLKTEKKEELKELKKSFHKEAEFFICLEKQKSKRDLLKKWKNKLVQSTRRELEQESSDLNFQSERIKDFFKQLEAGL